MYPALQISVTLPVSNASAERTFSAMKRIKSWLRASMGNSRLSDLAVINVNLEVAKKIGKDPDAVNDHFTKGGNRRLELV